MFIAVFALATVVIVGILVSYMSNWVNDMISTQAQVFFSKQSYWNAYSGIEIAGSKKIASLEGVPNANVAFATGTITVSQTTAANEYLGGNKISSITSAGSDVRGRSRSMKLAIGNPSPAEYSLFFDGSTGDFVDIGNINNKMEMLDTDGTITYVDGGAQADFSISFWIKPDYNNMNEDYGVIIAANNCTDAGDCNNDRGIIIGLLKASGFIRIWHPSSSETDFATALSANSWHHVVYTRSAANPTNGVGTIYLNGAFLGTDNWDNSWFRSAAAGESWFLGTDIDAGNTKSENYAGCLDEVAIWRAELDLSHIQTLYIQGKLFDIATHMSTNLVAYWDFDNTSNDASGNEFNSTITGAIYTGY